MVSEPGGLTEFLDLAAELGISTPTFGLMQFDAVVSWCSPVEPVLKARVLSALISTEPDAETIIACANAIAALDSWRELVLDLLAATAPGAVPIGILREVLRLRGTEHPLAAMAEAPQTVVAVYDAIHRPEGLLVSADYALPNVSEWLLLAAADPIAQIAAATSVRQPEGLLLVGPDAPWVERERAVCPAFFLLAA